MRTYAEYLNSLTVKTLNTIAKEMGLKGYSKLRKAALITVIDDAVTALMPTVLVEGTDDTMIVALLAEIAAEVAATPIEFSHPASTMAPAPIVAQTPSEADSLNDLKDAYRNMRRTINSMGARGAEGQRRIRYVGKLRNLSAQLKGMGIKNPALL